jgi:hypothetical protein
MRTDLLEYQRDFYNNARAESKSKFKGVVGDEKRCYRVVNELAKILSQHKIEMLTK